MKKISQIYSMLEDKESKEIYMNRLSMLITDNFDYMRDVIERYTPQLAALNNREIPKLLSSLPKEKPIMLYGAGNDAKANLHFFINDARFIGFCDKNENKQKNGFEGYPVISPSELLTKKNISIVISTHRGLVEIKNYLMENGICEEDIYEMTPYMFYMDEGQYFNPNFMTFEDEEVFIDAGSKDLGSIKELSRYCKKIRKAYAFEPDPDNFQDCMKKKLEYPSELIEVIPFGTWSEKTTLCFEATADGSSHVVEEGKAKINVIPIDEVIDGNIRITFIKMDVEGSELESLKGAKNTIKKDKPKLAVCIYHKPEDMITLPLYIKSLVPDYKLYLRHHSNGAGETVLYAMP